MENTHYTIQGVNMDIVRDSKYLGAHLDNKLDWTENTEAVHKRGQS